MNGRPWHYGVLKRALDLLVSAVSLLLLALPMALIALAVRWRMGAPVLYCQERPGLHAKPFRLYKFRSMTAERDAEGRLLSDGERLTPLGRLLRRTSLDELPELWLILTGKMSLVGPRPLLMRYLPRYSARQTRRHAVRPGLTGWAQVNGRNAVTWEERLEMDVWYVEHASLALDLRILLRTLGAVLRGEGISQKGHATMPEFMGTEQPS